MQGNLSRLSPSLGTLAVLAFAGMAIVSSQPTLAQTGAAPPVPGSPSHACNLLTSAEDVPDGFGAAYNLFSADKELLLGVECGSSSNATLTVGNGQNTTYVHRFGYEWVNGAWKQINLDGSQLAGQDWYVGTAKANLSRSQTELAQDNFVVAYTCLWQNSSWKCGCRDTSCTTNYWQLQAFRQEAQSGGGGSSGGGGNEPAMSAGGVDKNWCASDVLFGTGVKSVTPSNFKSVIAGANAGDIIVFQNGSYDGFTHSNDGRFDNPIVYRARNPGQATITGSVNLEGKYGVLACFKLHNNNIVVGVREGRDEEKGAGTRITRNWITTNIIPSGTTRFATRVYQSRNVRYDHNDCGDVNNGFTAHCIMISNKPGGNSRIDHNRFHGSPNRLSQGGEYEAIWLLGTFAISAFEKTGFLVDHNLFERWNGDDEVIAVKTSGVTVRNNTFRNNQWGPNLRFGEANIVKNNIFDGSDLSVRGTRHIIVGNKFVQSSDRLRLREGTQTSEQFREEVASSGGSGTCCGFEQVTDAIVYGNQGGTIEVGAKPSGAVKYPPKNSKLGSNTGTLKLIHHEGTITKYSWSGSVGTPSGVTASDVGPHAP